MNLSIHDYYKNREHDQDGDSVIRSTMCVRLAHSIDKGWHMSDLRLCMEVFHGRL